MNNLLNSTIITIHQSLGLVNPKPKTLPYRLFKSCGQAPNFNLRFKSLPHLLCRWHGQVVQIPSLEPRNLPLLPYK